MVVVMIAMVCICSDEAMGNGWVGGARPPPSAARHDKAWHIPLWVIIRLVRPMRLVAPSAVQGRAASAKNTTLDYRDGS